VQASDAFYKRPLLIERGSFRPVTLVTNDMLDGARAMFEAKPSLAGEKPEILMEITMKNLLSGGGLDLRDFLDRVDMLGALGRTVLISNYGEFHRLIQYLTRYTDRPIGLPLGLPSLHEIFDEKYYADLEGGILEGLGRLFKAGVRLYVYPTKDEAGRVIGALDHRVAPNLSHLYAHLLENRFILPIRDYHADYLDIRSSKVLELLRSGDARWEAMVPPEVAGIIRERGLFVSR